MPTLVDYEHTSFASVEHRIGRKIEECIQDKPFDGAQRFDDRGKTFYFWVPSFEIYREVFLEVAEHYRQPQNFQPHRKEVWPYFDMYSSLLLGMVLKDDQFKGMSSIDSLNRQRLQYGLTSSEAETIFGHVEHGLFFTDGAQVGDPFLSLSTKTIEKAALSPLSQTTMGLIPPRWLLDSHFCEDDTTLVTGLEIKDYIFTWMSVIDSAKRVKPLVKAGVVRLTPGHHAALPGFWKFAQSERRLTPFLEIFGSVVAKDGKTIIDGANEFRAAQQIIDASHFHRSSPFFHNKEQLAFAQKLISEGFASRGLSRERILTSNLSSLVTINTRLFTQTELIAIRRDEEMFGKWRSVRQELIEHFLTEPSPQELEELRTELTQDWLNVLRQERRKDSVLSQNFAKGGLVVGSVSGIVGSLAEVMAPGSLAILNMLTAGTAGFIGGGGGAVGYELLKNRGQHRNRREAHLALERHLMAFDPDTKVDL